MATFKKDWTPADAPLSADVNRWETNTEEAYNLADHALYWGQLMHISGNLGGINSQIVGTSHLALVDLQAVMVLVKPRPGVGLGTGLQIRYIGFCLNPFLRLRIRVDGESSYFQSDTEADYYDAADKPGLNNVLFENFTDEPVMKKVIVSVYNTNELSADIHPWAGWSFRLAGAVTYQP